MLLFTKHQKVPYHYQPFYDSACPVFKILNVTSVLGSKFYENELRKDEQINRRIRDQRTRLERLTNADLLEGKRAVHRIMVLDDVPMNEGLLTSTG